MDAAVAGHAGGPGLWGAAVLTVILCALLLRRFATWRVAVAAAAAKGLAAAAYFQWFYDGSWTVLDDQAYFRHGRILLDAGFNPVSALVQRKGITTLLLLSEGPHILYSWFNLAAQWTLGQAYWAPVFGNVVLTCVAARLLFAIARRCGADDGYARALALFFALQWELVAWSSFLNVKDVMVMTLTLALLAPMLRLTQGFRWGSLLLAVLAGATFLWIRFYVPLVATLAFALHMVRWRGLARWRTVFALLGVLAVGALTRNQLLGLAGILRLDAANLAFGWLRTLLSPQPWSLQAGYGFLLVPAVLHFVAFPLLVYGAWALVRHPGPRRFPFIYAALVLVSVAAYPELQGPRHRIQLLPVIAWAQFHGAYLLMQAFLEARRARVPAIPA
ncbi:MAG TPA: hypothetical protein VGD77_12395 [Gemmatimonadaceae bacterium]